MADINKRYSMFDLCKEYPDRYLCVRNYDASTHEADFVGDYGSESLQAAQMTFKDAEFFYATPKGGYAPVVSAEVGTRGSLPYFANKHRDCHLFLMSLEDGVNLIRSTVIFINAVPYKDKDLCDKVSSALFDTEAMEYDIYTGPDERGLYG